MVIPNRILCIETRPSSLHGAAQVIEESGMEIWITASGSAGKAIAERWTPDAVLVDAAPNGAFPTAVTLRGYAATRTIPIIAVSSGSHVEIAKSFQEAGIDGFVAEDAPPEIMMDAIRGCIEAMRLQHDENAGRGLR